MVVANRYNFSLDQRISIRGFGSRSNFGVRGIKILLDGVPQTLPDGQSQLTNVDFANIERAEVLRGASSSLYGNGSGGVVALTSERAAPGPFAQRLRIQGGDGKRTGDGFYKAQTWTSARSGSLSGTLSLSQFKADGFRQHSAAEFRQLNSGIDYTIGGSTLATLRLSLADDPRAENPGALTLAEYNANPDSAAASNIRRGADKDAQQYQLALGMRHFDAKGNEYEATVFGLLRDLANPLAAPPFTGAPPTAGTYVAIDRAVGGARSGLNQRLGAGESRPSSPPGPTSSGCGTIGKISSPMRVSERRPCCWISGSWLPSSGPLPRYIGVRINSCCSAPAPDTTGCASTWPTISSPTATTAGPRPWLRSAATSD